MNEEANVNLLRQAYKHFKSGDVDSLLGLYSEDVEWTFPEMENVPYAGKRIGLDSLKEFFAIVNDDLETLRFEPREFIAQGDRVVSLGNYTFRVKSTNNEFSSEWAHVCTCRGGKIISFQDFADTAAAIRAHTTTMSATGNR